MLTTSSFEEPLLQPSNASPSTLLEYLDYLAKSEPPFAKNWTRECVLTLDAICAMLLYIKPCWLVGMKQMGLAGAILHEIGGLGSAAYVAVNVGGHYFDLLKASRDVTRFLRQRGKISQEKAQHANSIFDQAEIEIRKRSRSQKCCDALKNPLPYILTVAAFTALPLAAAALFYRDWEGEADGWIWAKAAITFLVNTLTHTLPISIIFDVFSNLFSKCCLKRAKHAPSLVEQPQILSGIQLRSHLSTFFSSLPERLELLAVKKKSGCHWYELESLHAPHNSTEFLHLIQRLYDPHISELNQHSKQVTRGLCGTLNTCSRFIIGWLGAGLATAGLLGFGAVTWKVFLEKLLYNSTLGASIVLAFSITPTIILTGYFGRQVFKDIYDWLYSLLSGHPQLPLFLKLSPKTYLTCLSFLVFLDAFGWGTALQLFDDTLGKMIDDDSFREFLRGIVIGGLIIYGLPNAAQATNKVIEAFLTTRFGSKDSKEFIKILRLLRDRSPAFFSHLKLEHLKQLEQFAQQTELENLQTLGLTKEPESQRVIISTAGLDHASHVNAATHKVTSGCCGLHRFWGGGHRSEIQNPLTLPTLGPPVEDAASYALDI